MEQREFLKMVARMGEKSVEEFEYESDGKRYGFYEMDDDGWDDEGKYQYKTEKGKLVQFKGEEGYETEKEFNFGVSRVVQRSGSYFSDYYYEYEKWEPFIIEEVYVPEVVIPAHTELKEKTLEIDKEIYEEIRVEKEIAKKAKEMAKQLEEEEKLRQEELRKKYAMNDQEVIKKVTKQLKKSGVGFTMRDMQKEYFKIVEAEGIKDEDWLEYHRKYTLNK